MNDVTNVQYVRRLGHGTRDVGIKASDEHGAVCLE